MGYVRYTIQIPGQGSMQVCCTAECGRLDPNGYTVHHCGVDASIARRLDYRQTVPQPGLPPGQPLPPRADDRRLSRRVSSYTLGCGHSCYLEVTEEHGPGCPNHLVRPTVRRLLPYDDYRYAIDLFAFSEEEVDHGDASVLETDESSSTDEEDEQPMLPGRVNGRKTPAAGSTESPSPSRSPGAGKRRRRSVDPEVTRARRASLRPRVRKEQSQR